MRLVFRIHLRLTPPHTALSAAVILAALSAGVNAQEPVSASSTGAGSAALASTLPAAAAAQDPVAGNSDAAADTQDASAQAGELAGAALSISADTASSSDQALDDQVLSRQRGGFSGMLMVAATPQLMRGTGSGGNGVTLWDEIAPPSPLPVPIDAARTAQDNVANYQRK